MAEKQTDSFSSDASDGNPFVGRGGLNDIDRQTQRAIQQVNGIDPQTEAEQADDTPEQKKGKLRLTPRGVWAIILIATAGTYGVASHVEATSVKPGSEQTFVATIDRGGGSDAAFNDILDQIKDSTGNTILNNNVLQPLATQYDDAKSAAREFVGADGRIDPGEPVVVEYHESIFGTPHIEAVDPNASEPAEK